MIIWGIERKKVFRSDCDQRDFLSRIPELISETKTDCFARAIIPNHAHLLLREGSDSGGSEFVEYVLKAAEEALEGSYALKAMGDVILSVRL